MKICKGTIVSIDYELKDDGGNLIDKSDENRPLTYLQGYGNIIPGLELELEGKREGDALKVRVEPEQGYGVSRPDMIQIVPLGRFEGVENGVQVGMQFHARTEQGVVITVRVVKVEGDEVTIDGNHELAGVALNFDVNIREIRLATVEELDHGHPHVSGGCCGGHGHGDGECCGGSEKAEDCDHDGSCCGGH